MIEEASCVFVQAGAQLHLVLRCDEIDLDHIPGTLRVFAPDAFVVLLIGGGAAFDFAWTCRCPRPGEVSSGVAAAMAARLQGSVLDEPVLIGLNVGTGKVYDFVAPTEWWRGGWLVHLRDIGRAQPSGVLAPADAVTARLLLHGDIVLA